MSSSDPIDLVIESRPANVGGVHIRRILPSRLRRLVGPFIFLDHFGPFSIATAWARSSASSPAT